MIVLLFIIYIKAVHVKYHVQERWGKNTHTQVTKQIHTSEPYLLKKVLHSQI